MKKVLSLTLLILPALIFSQVGIGTNSPNPSAMLDITATNKGFLPPRIALSSLNDITTIVSPVESLIIFNTATAGTSPNNVIPGLYYFEKNKWNRVISQQPDATVTFSTASPNTGSPTFTPNIPSSTNYIYVSTVDNSQWTWNGSTYLTYIPPPTTSWNISGTNNDAGSNKTAAIARTGIVGIGNNNPNANLDIRTNPTNTTDPGIGYFGLGTTTASASAAGAGALRYSTQSGGTLEYSNGSNWNILSSTVQKANVYATRLSSAGFTIPNNAGSVPFNLFSSTSGSGLVNFNTSTGVFTAPRTGLYTISAGMSFQLQQTSNIGSLFFLVVKNGNIEMCNQVLPISYAAFQDLSANISCLVPLIAGETVQIIYHNATGSPILVTLAPNIPGRFYFNIIEN